MTDTIFALATPPGRAAVAVLRLSGPRVGEIIERLADDLPPARHAGLRMLRGADDEALDEALVLWFPAPRSYTGEPCAELQLHGGDAVVDAVCEALIALGARAAEPGEFTRRAFENGRMDLTQAEAVADLVDAETAAQRRQALDQLGGALSRRYEAWRALLLEALAVLEAAIDFPDEDLPADVGSRARPPLQALLAELDAALADAARGERVREGYRIAILGAPNAGKSSLLNRILGRDAAIVTATPGTTRDVIEAPLSLGGYKAVIADMAGLRPVTDPVEAEGVRRAKAWAEAADLRIWVVDGSASAGGWREAAALAQRNDLLALNKGDLAPGEDAAAARAVGEARGLEMIGTSAATGQGLDELRRRLSDKAAQALAGGDFPAVTRERHRKRLMEARDALARGLGQLGRKAELAAEDLRLAGRALGRISGRFDPEDVLGQIFASFCIGK